MIPWLRPGDSFPAPSTALSEPNGLLAASMHLDATTLEDAYRQGIFPWYSGQAPMLWWCPHPRMVLFTDRFRVSKSFRRTLSLARHDPDLSLRLDHDFVGVMQACAAPRPGQDGTWINPDMVAAYSALHARGLAHSMELWQGQTLIGGAYGVSLGKMFYGESMFSRAPDASKIALAAVVSLLRLEGVPMIDCQQNTRHLASLGAGQIPRDDFLGHLAQYTGRTEVAWASYRHQPLQSLLDPYL